MFPRNDRLRFPFKCARVQHGTRSTWRPALTHGDWLARGRQCMLVELWVQKALDCLLCVPPAASLQGGGRWRGLDRDRPPPPHRPAPALAGRRARGQPATAAAGVECVHCTASASRHRQCLQRVRQSAVSPTRPPMHPATRPSRTTPPPTSVPRTQPAVFPYAPTVQHSGIEDFTFHFKWGEPKAGRGVAPPCVCGAVPTLHCKPLTCARHIPTATQHTSPPHTHTTTITTHHPPTWRPSHCRSHLPSPLGIKRVQRHWGVRRRKRVGPQRECCGWSLGFEGSCCWACVRECDAAGSSMVCVGPQRERSRMRMNQGWTMWKRCCWAPFGTLWALAVG